MKTVLVIDMQEDFFREGPLKDLREGLIKNINALTRLARNSSVPVIWVRQEFQEDLSDAFLIMKKEKIQITIAGTKGCEILSELVREKGENEIVKRGTVPSLAQQ